jgi:aminopeptidase N
VVNAARAQAALGDLEAATFAQQDVAHWYVYFIRNQYTRSATWQWLQQNWQWIEHTFAGDKSYDEFPRYTAMGLTTSQQLAEYTSFFEPLRSHPALKRNIELGSTEIAARIELIQRDTPGVIEALKTS